MKICPKCRAEYDDDSNFCKKCGTPLTSNSFCPKCGAKVGENDAFCSKCGHQLNGITSNENINNTVPAQQKKPIDVDKVKKYFYFSLLTLALIACIILFIGCFGDIMKTTSYLYDSGASRAATRTENVTSISYYFGDRVDEINRYSDTMKYNEYPTFLMVLFVIQVVLWLISIFGATTVFVMCLIKVFHVLQNKPNGGKHYLFIAPLTVLPYLFFISLSNFSFSEVKRNGITYSNSSVDFGWGTTMMLVAVLILLALFFIDETFAKTLYRYRKNQSLDFKALAFDSFFSIFKFVTCLIFMFASKHTVDARYHEALSSTDSYTVKGNGTILSDYLGYLYSFSNDTIQKMPDFAPQLLTGYFLLVLGFITFSVMICISDNKTMVYAVLMAAFVLVLNISGFTFAYNASRDSLIQQAGGADASPEIIQRATAALKYSVLGIVSYVFTFATPIVLGIRKAVLK